MRGTRILALPRYEDKAASMRQRLQQFLPALEEEGIVVDVSPLLDNEHLERLSEGRGASVPRMLVAYGRRCLAILRARRYDGIWLHYESFPYLPSFVETLVFLAGRPIVLDFDDAIFHRYDRHRSFLVRACLGTKLQALMAGASVCAAGNDYLARYAGQFCADVRILPTVVDTAFYKPAAGAAIGAASGGNGHGSGSGGDCANDSSSDGSSDGNRDGNRDIGSDDARVTIGWIGTPTTWLFVEPLVPVLQRLAARAGVSVMIVGAGKLDVPPAGLRFVDWRAEREVADIQSMDIGIMPLPDEPWARGKCGYKLIQYMACGLPVVASPVGVNGTIVEHGRNGYLAASPEAFAACLERLIDDPARRSAMGAAGRARVESDYSLATHAPRFVQMINDAVAGRCAA